MTKLIAEIGWNHMGDMKLAKEMISAAKESGADFAKFQTWSVERLKPGVWDTDGRREIYENAELDLDKHFDLKNYCDEVGIDLKAEDCREFGFQIPQYGDTQPKPGREDYLNQIEKNKKQFEMVDLVSPSWTIQVPRRKK